MTEQQPEAPAIPDDPHYNRFVAAQVAEYERRRNAALPHPADGVYRFAHAAGTPAIPGVTRWRVTEGAITAAAEAIDGEFRDTDGRSKLRWSRDLAIIALEAAMEGQGGPVYEPAYEPLVLLPDEFGAARRVWGYLAAAGWTGRQAVAILARAPESNADAPGMPDPPDDTSRAFPASLAGAQPLATAPLPGCPTPCDADCGASCHQSHNPVHKRWHDPGWSCEMVQEAIAEAVSAERARADAAEAKLTAVRAYCRERDTAYTDAGTQMALAGILVIVGSEEGDRG